MIVRVGVATSYTLNKLDRTPVSRMWNATHLKKYYQLFFFLVFSFNYWNSPHAKVQKWLLACLLKPKPRNGALPTCPYAALKNL